MVMVCRAPLTSSALSLSPCSLARGDPLASCVETAVRVASISVQVLPSPSTLHACALLLTVSSLQRTGTQSSYPTREEALL